MTTTLLERASNPRSDLTAAAVAFLHLCDGDVDVAAEALRLVAEQADLRPCVRPVWVAPGRHDPVPDGTGWPRRAGERLHGLMERRAERLVAEGVASFERPGPAPAPAVIPHGELEERIAQEVAAHNQRAAHVRTRRENWACARPVYALSGCAWHGVPWEPGDCINLGRPLQLSVAEADALVAEGVASYDPPGRPGVVTRLRKVVRHG